MGFDESAAESAHAQTGGRRVWLACFMAEDLTHSLRYTGADRRNSVQYLYVNKHWYPNVNANSILQLQLNLE